MSTAIVKTTDNNDNILLSVDTDGSRAETAIFISNHQINTSGKSMTDFFLGTNRGLKGNVITIVTQVLRFPADNPSSVVTFTLKGAVDVAPAISRKDFPEGAPMIPHVMTYFFV